MHSPIFFAEATYLALPKTQEHTDTKPKLQYTEIKPNGFFWISWIQEINTARDKCA